MDHDTPLSRAAAALGQWQKHNITKQLMKHGKIPHPAAAPLTTDQEAGGQSTTPSGTRLHDSEGESRTIRE